MALVPETIIARAFLGVGNIRGSERKMLDFSDDDLTATICPIVAKELAAAATNQAVDLSTFIDSIKYLAIFDKNGTGLEISFSNGGTYLPIGANGCLFWRYDSSAAPPTIYLKNPSLTDKAFVEIALLGDST